MDSYQLDTFWENRPFRAFSRRKIFMEENAARALWKDRAQKKQEAADSLLP